MMSKKEYTFEDFLRDSRTITDEQISELADDHEWAMSEDCGREAFGVEE